MSADRRVPRPGAVGGGVALGVGVTAAMVSGGVATPVAIGVGGALALPLVLGGLRRPREKPERIDPFVLGEPWRHFVAQTEKAERQLRSTIARVEAGPRRERLESIADRMDQARRETWRLARHGDEIDDARRKLDTTSLRERRATIAEGPDDDPTRASRLEAIDSQLATSDRLRQRSDEAAEILRSSVARFDELVARATEIAVDTSAVPEYEHEVDDLIIELESLRLAAEETDEA